MKLRAAWLITTTLMFVGWLGWLAYLAATTAHPITLSRPQLLVSTLDVVAEVVEVKGQPAEMVTVVAIHWPSHGPEQKLVGQRLRITNLPRCHDKWIGSGGYILPLVKDADDYRVAAIPRSPGYINPDLGVEETRIYPVTSQTLKQLDLIPKPDGPRQ